jgi:hypothetical protein
VQGKMEVPSYFRLADLILSTINSRNLELGATIERSLD